MKRVLITGCTGFSGAHLAEHLLNKDYEVYGIVRGRCKNTEFINHIINKIKLMECDLTDASSIHNTLI